MVLDIGTNYTSKQYIIYEWYTFDNVPLKELLIYSITYVI